MVRIDDAVVRDGSLVLAHLPFHDGQRVTVVINEVDSNPATRRTIEEVRRLLRGRVRQFDEPFEPMIPTDSWDALK